MKQASYPYFDIDKTSLHLCDCDINVLELQYVFLLDLGVDQYRTKNIVVNIELCEHPSYVKNIKGNNLSIKCIQQILGVIRNIKNQGIVLIFDDKKFLFLQKPFNKNISHGVRDPKNRLYKTRGTITLGECMIECLNIGRNCTPNKFIQHSLK